MDKNRIEIENRTPRGKKNAVTCFEIPVVVKNPRARAALEALAVAIDHNPRKLGTVGQIHMNRDDRGRWSVSIKGMLLPKKAFEAVRRAMVQALD